MESVKNKKTIDIRKAFLDFFESKGHKIYASMNLVPQDATLLFTNAGMVQFKDIFTGKVPTPENKRATSSQLCIRAGGKHNDLENVGYTNRHHTLFEMLGNFSFGDYFKKEAIDFAWEFVTEVIKLPKDKLYVSVHENDDEAFNLWSKIIDPSRIQRMGDKDNFWQMGNTGACGPCSEIFIDQGEEFFNGPEDYFGGDGDRFLEIWNLVFMQFERSEDGTLTPLPKPSIDTGMGLERMQAVLEGVHSNFHSSLFMPIIKKVEEISGIKYDNNPSFRVISDHARTICFLLAQGVLFDKEGRGYVARRILRRALRHGYLLGLKEAFMYKVMDSVIEVMSGHYEYLLQKRNFIKEQVKAEEERFLQTIELGMNLFKNELDIVISENRDVFSAQVAFKLYDTFGFPLDLTLDMLLEHKIKLDVSEFDKYMEIQKESSRQHWKGSGDELLSGDFKILLDKFSVNKFIGHDFNESQSEILALMDSNFAIVDTLEKGQDGFIMLDTTPFYAQGGGPVGDCGEIFIDDKKIADVLDTKKYFDLNLSNVRALQNLSSGLKIKAKVSKDRLEIAKHHSATHLLNAVLHEVLGEHINQAGSSVTKDRLRFDFTHNKALSEDELEKIQNGVNELIFMALKRKIEMLDINEAKARGAIALFNEKYDDIVRVLSFENDENKIYSMELCGGIHVENTAVIGSFIITKESAISSGVRRIEAVCGRSALEYIKNLKNEMQEIKNELKSNNILDSIKKLKNKNNAKNGSKNNNLDFKIREINGVSVILECISDDIDAKAQMDLLLQKYNSSAILLMQKDDKLKIFIATKNAKINAKTWMKALDTLNVKGGGRDDFISAGCKDVENKDRILKDSLTFLQNNL